MLPALDAGAVMGHWRGGPFAVACIVLLVSFADNVMLTRTDTTSAFYLPLPRFWELMLGSGLAFLPPPNDPAKGIVR